MSVAEVSRHAVRANVGAERLSRETAAASAPYVARLLQTLLASLRGARTQAELRAAILRCAGTTTIPPGLVAAVRTGLDKAVDLGARSAAAEQGVRAGLTAAEQSTLGAKTMAHAAAVARGIFLGMLKRALEFVDQGADDADAFRETLGDQLREEWGSAKAGRVALAAEVAVRNGLSLGRMTVTLRPESVKARPYWLFSAILDALTSDTCETCDHVVLPVRHPWWAKHIPPLHLHCRSDIVALTAAQALRIGVTKTPPVNVEVEEGFGRLRDLCSWEPRPGKYPAELLDLVETP